MPKDNADIFKPLQEHFAQEEYNDYDLFTLIGHMIDQDPAAATAMAFHARDVLWEGHSEDVTYSAIIAEVFRRTFYDETQAAKYGTDNIAQDRARLRDFTQTFITMQQQKFTHASFAPSSSAAH